VLVWALSTGHKLGLGLMGAAFIVFALVSAFVVPRGRPNFPGRGLRFFVLTCLAFFAAMLAAVVIFGVEEKGGAEAAAGTEKPAGAAAPSSGSAAVVKKVDVSLVDFKIELTETSLAPGKYDFAVSNDGKVPHNLTIDGPGVKNAATPTFGGGGSRDLQVTLKAGTYEFYCSVPGHKEVGMDVKVTVS
jgi:uncharacterized cupredoxin-like copper-binding protein